MDQRLLERMEQMEQLEALQGGAPQVAALEYRVEAALPEREEYSPLVQMVLKAAEAPKAPGLAREKKRAQHLGC